MNRNEYIASIMLEAAELLKNDNNSYDDYDSLNEGYIKDSFALVKDDFNLIKNNMIKANKMRTDSDFDNAKSLLNDTIKIVHNAKTKINKINDEKLLQKLWSSIIGQAYVNFKSNLYSQSTQTYFVGNTTSVSTIRAAQDDGLKGFKALLSRYLNAVLIDIDNIKRLCDKRYTGKLKDLHAITLDKDKQAFNYYTLNRGVKKLNKEAKKSSKKASNNEAIQLLYKQALLSESIDEYNVYANALYELGYVID